MKPRAAASHPLRSAIIQLFIVVGVVLVTKTVAAEAYYVPSGSMQPTLLIGDELIWIDEALTPDSSRFWPAASYAPGRAQPSFDKQYVRDYLERIGWNKQPPGPELPPDVVSATTAKYREAYRLITGDELP